MSSQVEQTLPGGPPSPVRDWLAWAAVWTLVLHSPMWIAVGIDSVEEHSNPTMEATPVAEWVPVLGTGLAVAVPAALLLSLFGAGAVRPRRSGLVLGGLALLVAAVTWTGFPDHDTGEWYVALTALAAACALAAAALPDPHPQGAELRGVSLVVGGVLVVAGLVVMVTCWRGGAYWDWRGRSAGNYRAGLVLGGMQVLLGLVAPWWVPGRLTRLRWFLGPAGAVVGTGALGLAATYFVDRGILYRWAEDGRAWDTGTPLLIAGVGLLATSVGAWRRRGDLAGLSLAAATTVGLFALWQESTWGRVMS